RLLEHRRLSSRSALRPLACGSRNAAQRTTSRTEMPIRKSDEREMRALSTLVLFWWRLAEERDTQTVRQSLVVQRLSRFIWPRIETGGHQRLVLQIDDCAHTEWDHSLRPPNLTRHRAPPDLGRPSRGTRHPRCACWWASPKPYRRTRAERLSPQES